MTPRTFPCRPHHVPAWVAVPDTDDMPEDDPDLAALERELADLERRNNRPPLTPRQTSD
ncbi:MAG: hypothetical protein ACK4FB_08850 [Brevundimonas sp.]|uniref:hypothetical protein n=1 Tax=Brevundimonas sp. TaxID=1871086 RepID=UPI00391A2BCF